MQPQPMPLDTPGTLIILLCESQKIELIGISFTAASAVIDDWHRWLGSDRDPDDIYDLDSGGRRYAMWHMPDVYGMYFVPDIRNPKMGKVAALYHQADVARQNTKDHLDLIRGAVTPPKEPWQEGGSNE